tara:strand:- start:300 stop:989 length:690 start_codon:yes stop_codon:yes gene_type:complete
MKNFSTELSELVGTGEAWIRFMDIVKSELADVLRPGKPKREAIEKSKIGELGFKSWVEFIEAPRSENGLAWNVASWKLYKKAYSVVEQHPYLRQTEHSASFIATLSRELEPFPATKDELAEALTHRESKLETRKESFLSQAKEEINDLKNQIADLNILIAEQRGKIEASEALRADFEELSGKHGALSEKYAQVSSQLLKAKTTINNQQVDLKLYENMTFLERLKFLFGL